MTLHKMGSTLVWVEIDFDHLFNVLFIIEEVFVFLFFGSIVFSYPLSIVF